MAARPDRPDAGDEVLVAAHAVADPTRLAVLRRIQAADVPVGVRELATGLGLHQNAVRKHLAQLRDAGLVVEEVEHRGTAGRPRLTYTPDPDSVAVFAGWNPYEALSVLLVAVASGRSPREVGADYGRRLAATASERAPIDLVEAVTRRHGFHPTREVHGAETHLVLGRCPFASSVTADRLVCDLHLGIAEGIAATTGTVTVTGLDVAPPRTGGCRFRLELAHEPEGETR